MFDLDTCVGFTTSKTAKIVADAFNKRLVCLGITRVQWIALYFLGQDHWINQRELGQKMNIKEATVARLVNRMERDGYIVRYRDETDRRVWHIALTERGIEYRERLLPEGQKMSDICGKNISDEDMETFKTVLKQITRNVAMN